MSAELQMNLAPAPIIGDDIPVGHDEYATEIFTADFGSDGETPVFNEKPLLGRKRSFAIRTGPLAESVRKIQRGGLQCISFHDLCYQVPQRKALVIKQPDKKILKSLNGVLSPGLNAIMGTSGSGKSTLLDILADRKDSSHVTGSVLVNGQERCPNFKAQVGYVVQEDIVMGSLTVRENLRFSAALRLPSSMTREEKKARVEEVLKQLKITHCADTTVGTEFVRGISGGEKRRTNIGMELIIAPQILFLDEPTTGLDAHTAASVISVVKELSQVKDRIIIMSIHQPRYSIFKLFDTITLLAHGDLIFQGYSGRVVDFIESLGCSKCEENENPADYILDSIYTCENGHGTGGHLSLVEEYKQSNDYKQLKPVLDNIARRAAPDENARCQKRFTERLIGPSNYASNFLFQLLLVTIRSTVNHVRRPTPLISQVVTQTIVGTLIGIIYFDLDTDELGFQDRLGVLFFITIQIAFANQGSIDVFLEEKRLFFHEHAGNYYRVSAYFLSKIVTDMIGVKLIPITVFIIITYWMIGLQDEADKFFIYFGLIFLVSFVGTSAVFLFSAISGSSALANTLTVLYFILVMQFGGVLISLDSLDDWIGWLQYLSFMRYAVEGVTNNEMNGLAFDCRENSSLAACDSDDGTFSGLDELENRGFEADWIEYDVMALIVHIILFLILTYVVLRVSTRRK